MRSPGPDRVRSAREVVRTNPCVVPIPGPCTTTHGPGRVGYSRWRRGGSRSRRRHTGGRRADDNAPALRDVSTQQPRLPDSEAQPGKGERPFFALCRAALPHLQTRLDQAVWMLLVSYCRVWVGASRIGKCSPGHARMCADLRLDERALRRSLARIVGGGRLQIRKRGRTETAEHVVAPFGFGGLVALTDEDPGWIDQEPEPGILTGSKQPG